MYKHAIIDIGSNTVRLVIYDGPSRAPAVLLNEKVTAKLGKDVARDGLLGGKAMTLALSALARYATLLRLMSVNDVEVVATAAARAGAREVRPQGTRYAARGRLVERRGRAVLPRGRIAARAGALCHGARRLADRRSARL
jgi:hypothetical protein